MSPRPTMKGKARAFLDLGKRVGVVLTELAKLKANATVFEVIAWRAIIERDGWREAFGKMKAAADGFKAERDEARLVHIELEARIEGLEARVQRLAAEGDASRQRDEEAAEERVQTAIDRTRR